MERVAYCLFLFLCFHYMTWTVESTAKSNPDATNFIEVSCRTTRYPALCVQCLSTYADKIQNSERQIAQVALSVSLAKAQSTAMLVSKLPKVSKLKPIVYQAIKDCIENMGDSVDQLARSLNEMGHMNGGVGRQDFMWHASNVQTWVSAALTDQNTCVDGFAGHFMDGNVKALIRNRVINVAQVTSNALALVNRFAARHKTTATNNVP